MTTLPPELEKELADLFGAPATSTVVACSRCGLLCKLAATKTEEARLLQHATTRKEAETGLCVNCAATEFLQSVEPIRMAVERDGTWMITDAQFQEGMARLLRVGMADAKFEEIDWARVANDWGKPFPKRKGQRRKSQAC